MFGISSFEFLVILLVGVVVLGPDRLPPLIRLIVRLISELRRLTTDLQRSVNLNNVIANPGTLKQQAEDLFFGSKKVPDKNNGQPQPAPPAAPAAQVPPSEAQQTDSSLTDKDQA